MAATVEIDSVTKIFGSGADAVHALGPADLSVAAGEFVSLLGPSGCGKSTLLLMIAGLLELTEGDIRINGEQVFPIGDKVLGMNVPADWEDMLALMKTYNDLETEKTAADFYTNDFLP